MLELEGLQSTFIAIIPRSTLAQSGSTSSGSIYGSNRTVWNFNQLQTINFCWTELLGIKLFDPFYCGYPQNVSTNYTFNIYVKTVFSIK